jgi:FkbM family methyltransferase
LIYAAPAQRFVSMKGLATLVCIMVLLQCVHGQTAAGESEETKTGGGYNHFLTAVVDKKFVEDHLSGTIDWRRTATYSDELAAIPASQYRTFKKAQHAEDIDLYERYFKGKEKGLILESGAFDGYNVSTTLFFEKFAGWSAVHVEADPGNFAKLAVNRQNSVNVHMALCDEPRILHYVDTGITLAHGIAEFMPDSFLRMHHPRLFRNRTLIHGLREIPCFPAKYLFRYLKLTELDIWVLDTEGSELAVLNGVNFNRIKIKVIIMECDEHDAPKNAQKMAFLQQRGYTCSTAFVTCFCSLNEKPPQSEEILQLPGREQTRKGGMGALTTLDSGSTAKQQLLQQLQAKRDAKKGQGGGKRGRGKSNGAGGGKNRDQRSEQDTME